MSLAAVDKLVEAVLYEGYILYPYRPSSTKNRQRFTFGRVYPEAFSVAQRGLEPCALQTQCLLHQLSATDPILTVKLRFLQPIARRVGRLAQPFAFAEWSESLEPEIQPVAQMQVGDRLYQTWQEAVERPVVFTLPLCQIAETQRIPFRFDAAHSIEPIRDGDQIVGVLDRQQAALDGIVEISAESLENCSRLTIRVINHTPLADAESKSSEDDAVLLRTFASTHVIVTAEDGEFISLLEPPPAYVQAAADCRSDGLFPVLVGSKAEPILLASPIILYDFPEIAPESGGDLFDSTEIDEILTLRILSMTDDEKAEMRQVDERARQLLQRTESLLPDDLMALHGTLREMRPQRSDDHE